MAGTYQTKDAYYADRVCCPSCGAREHRQTLMGYLFRPGVPFKDENRVTCDCGWVGLVHALVPPGKDERP